MSTLSRLSRDLARVVDRLSTRIERDTLPESAAEVAAPDLSDAEAVALALFAEAGPGTDIAHREEKIALAGVIARRARAGRARHPNWRGAIERICPSWGGPRWRLGIALLFERPGLIPAAERAVLRRDRRRATQEWQQCVEIARLALAGVLPVNTPGADRFATDSEIAFAKAEGRVTPATLVRYGDHWFYKAKGGGTPAVRGRTGPRGATR